jgi:hypothetical protein
VVVLAGLDESYFMASYEEVHTLPAAKGPDGRYHIHGDLVLASREAQKKLLDLLEPIWTATAGIKTLVVGPVVWYITNGCCDDANHMPNRRAANFETKLRQVVAAAKTALKEKLRSSGHNHCRVMDMAMDMAGKAPAEIWGDDPTMPKSEIFDSLVAAMPSAEARIDLHKKRQGEELESVAKKPRLESAVRNVSKEGHNENQLKAFGNRKSSHGGGDGGGDGGGAGRGCTSGGAGVGGDRGEGQGRGYKGGDKQSRRGRQHNSGDGDQGDGGWYEGGDRHEGGGRG